MTDSAGRTLKCLSAAALVLLLAIGLGCSMNPKERANPLDPLNPDTGIDPFQLSLSFVEVTDDTVPTMKIRLEWHDIDHRALDEYHIFRRVANDFDDWLTLVAVTSPGESTYTDMESDPRVRYYYQVTATFNGGVDSLCSESVVNNRLSY